MTGADSAADRGGGDDGNSDYARGPHRIHDRFRPPARPRSLAPTDAPSAAWDSVDPAATSAKVRYADGTIVELPKPSGFTPGTKVFVSPGQINDAGIVVGYSRGTIAGGRGDPGHRMAAGWPVTQSVKAGNHQPHRLDQCPRRAGHREIHHCAENILLQRASRSHIPSQRGHPSPRRWPNGMRCRARSRSRKHAS